MKYLHTMTRVRDLDVTLEIFCDGLGLKEACRQENEKCRYRVVFLAAEETPQAEVELTYNWPTQDGSPPEDYGSARNFGHLAFRVENIYTTRERPQKMDVTIFVRSPDLLNVELLQEGHLPPQEPWAALGKVDG